MVTLKEFNSLFTDNYNRLLRFANSYVRNTEISEEIVAEAFTKFWENRESISEGTNHPAYILTIVKNLSLNYLKRSALELNITNRIFVAAEWELTTRINSLEECDPDYLFSKEIENIIKATVDRLPQKTKQVFQLSRFEHKTNKEIAEFLNITVKGVEYHISQSIKELRHSLKDYLPASLLLFILI